LIEKIPVGSFEESEKSIKKSIKNDARSSKGRNSLIVTLKKEYNFKDYPKKLKDVNRLVDESFLTAKWNGTEAKKLTKTLMEFAGAKYTQGDFAAYLEKNQRPVRKGNEIEKEVYKYYNNWVNSTIIQYEDGQLESKYPEFRLLVNEYRDGILLFDLTQETVWDKASKDTTGLKAFHEAHKSDYMWGKRVNAVVVSCSDKSTATKVMKSLKKNSSLQSILDKYNKDSELTVKLDSNLYSEGQNALIDKVEWVKGASAIVEEDKRAKFVYIYEVLEPMEKELMEARGLIISDYQKELETAWIAELRAKYPVTVNKDLFKKVTSSVD
jgi:peptidyl-prolyl cis-trans isomerase SurA